MAGLKLHCLPAAQRRLWPELAAVPDEFVLCGDTALALHLGHRRSVDFVFIAYRDIDTGRLLRSVPFLDEAAVVQEAANSLTVEVHRGGPVRVSFIGVPQMKRLKRTQRLVNPTIRLASPIDLAGMKASVITQRVEVKDYLDLDAIFTRTSLTVRDALLAGQAIFGPQFNPLLSLKALGDLEAPELASLPSAVDRRLRDIIAGVDLKTLAAGLKTSDLSKRCRLKPIQLKSR